GSGDGSPRTASRRRAALLGSPRRRHGCAARAGLGGPRRVTPPRLSTFRPAPSACRAPRAASTSARFRAARRAERDRGGGTTGRRFVTPLARPGGTGDTIATSSHARCYLLRQRKPRLWPSTALFLSLSACGDDERSTHGSDATGS